MKRGVSEIVVLVVVACFFFLGVAGTKAAAEDKILIGAAISMTGKFAREGALVKEGYDFWKDWVNAR